MSTEQMEDFKLPNERENIVSDITAELSSDHTMRRLSHLYHWLSAKRFTILLYPLILYAPFVALPILLVLAVIFAPYVISVLYKEGKRGWLILLAVMVGIPIGLIFIPFEVPQIRIALFSLPLLMFYFYCVCLRWAVANWLSDTSIEGEAEVEAEDQ